jgi:hypothetical protein
MHETLNIKHWLRPCKDEWEVRKKTMHETLNIKKLAKTL